LLKRKDNYNRLLGPHASRALEIAERRSAIRKAFITEALIVEVNSGARVAGRSCDLVLNGCYVDTLNPFKEGTIVRLRLQHGDSAVESKGRIVYQVPRMGMGIVFNDMTPENQHTLDEWLAEVDAAAEPFDAPLPAAKVETIAKVESSEDSQVVQLINVLHKKGILTNAEATLLLKKPLE
jgi:hypothetical protein